MHFKGASLRRYRQHLYLIGQQHDLPEKIRTSSKPIIWSGEEKLCLFDGRVNLLFKVSKNTEIAQQQIFFNRDDKIEIYFRWQLSSSLTCLPIGRTGSRSIKKLLHEYHVPLWLRDWVPFVFINGELKMAVGLWLCETKTTEQQSCCLAISFV